MFTRYRPTWSSWRTLDRWRWCRLSVCCCNSKTVQDRATVTIVSRIWSFDRRRLQWPWTTPHFLRGHAIIRRL